MKENVYDKESFFGQYSKMARSVGGLESAGEWHELKRMLPAFTGKRVLDLGCGFGWHCRYAVEQGAASVTGTDLSEKMLEGARSRTDSDCIRYIRQPIEDINFPGGSFDIVLSSLAFHYVADFHAVCRKVYGCLAPDGVFVFSAEHPVFTAQGAQQWCCDETGRRLHWPVDRYFSEGRRQAVFLGEEVVKYHRTLTTYLGCLLEAGFTITGVVEPQPPRALQEENPDMQEELRRPMMLLVSAKKQVT